MLRLPTCASRTLDRGPTSLSRPGTLAEARRCANQRHAGTGQRFRESGVDSSSDGPFLHETISCFSDSVKSAPTYRSARFRRYRKRTCDWTCPSSNRLDTIEQIAQGPMRRRNTSPAQQEHLPLEHRSERVEHLARAGWPAAQHLFGHAERGSMRREGQMFPMQQGARIERHRNARRRDGGR